MKKRAGLPLEERNMASAAIARHLFSFPPYEKACEIYCYVSVRHEVETSCIIRESLRAGKRVAVPKVLGKRNMEFYFIDRAEELLPGGWGIPEPEGRGERLALPGKDALFIVPGVAFDRTGTRLGYGGGFYDAYLSRYPHCQTAALAFEVQLTERIPAACYDVRISTIITEKGIVTC